MIPPTPTPAEKREHTAFMALLRAMSRPGEVQSLFDEAGGDAQGQGSLVAVGTALLDLESTFYTPDPALQQRLTALGAGLRPPEEAEYLFFPNLDEAALAAISQAATGSLLFPEEAATVVLRVGLGQGQRLRLRGPGIKALREVQVSAPKSLWSLRQERVSFPLGWDLILVTLEGTCICIPRSTQVEVS